MFFITYMVYIFQFFYFLYVELYSSILLYDLNCKHKTNQNMPYNGISSCHDQEKREKECVLAEFKNILY